jgi:hypothetical protein
LVVTAISDGAGFYALPLLPPGLVEITISAEHYQQQQVSQLDLPVAGRLDLDVQLRPLADVWEAGEYRSVFLPGGKAVVTFYGPDVDASRSAYVSQLRGTAAAPDSTVSNTVDPVQIAALPLSGRDAYTMLVTQPGVTSDTATARSLGIAANGQRPASGNFLLDGLENNNNLVTGPLTVIAPEALQEYRVSINNFSAEYGGTSGYIANAVTRAGTSDWHGLAYVNVKNEILNANEFQWNRLGFARNPIREAQPGFQAGGPLLRETFFVSGALDGLRSRGRREPAPRRVPTGQLLELAAPGSRTRDLLTRFAPPATTAEGSMIGTLTTEPTVSVDRWLGLLRFDLVSSGGKHRLTSRTAVSRLARPDFAWSPYPDFTAGFEQDDMSIAFALTNALTPHLTQETRVGWNSGSLALERPHSEIPYLVTGEGVSLPGSDVVSEFANDSRSWEVVENISIVTSNHAWKFGGGFLVRRLEGELTAARDGLYFFNTIQDFARDQPRLFAASLSRSDLPAFRLPRFDRAYGVRQFSLFAQDNWRATPDLTFNLGVRYESHGAPRILGESKDLLVELGEGDSLAEKLTGARLRPSVSPLLYEADRNNWAGRFGVSWRASRTFSTVLRSSYGIFYDRPFDNLWQNLRNNSFLFPRPFIARHTDYLAPISSVLPLYEGQPLAANYRFLTLFQPKFRSPYAQSYFFGVQQPISESWSAELNTSGSLGRKLITTDIVNRFQAINPELEEIIYRGNQGSSHYHGFTALVRRRGRFEFQAAYTCGHAIDNQSEALRNDYFDLNPIRLTGTTAGEPSTFSRQFDSSGDIANAAFDQRHNLVFFSIVDVSDAFRGRRLSPLLRNWRISQLAAFRSGFPYTVFSPGAPYRADLVRPDLLTPPDPDVPGGKRLIAPEAFARPAAGTGLLGTSGRNAFRGPGFYNLDVSLSRSFALRWLGEAGRFTLRADVYNILNHANLGMPATVFPNASFGIAQYGRRGPQAGLPALAPLNDSSRQIQMILRIAF